MMGESEGVGATVAVPLWGPAPWGGSGGGRPVRGLGLLVRLEIEVAWL